MNDRYSTGFKGLKVGGDKWQDYKPEKTSSQPPPNYRNKIPIGEKYIVRPEKEQFSREHWEKDGIADMQITSSDRVLICDRTGGAKTSLLKLLVFGLWKAGHKLVHFTDVKNDFANIDDENGVPKEFAEEAGLPPGQPPEPVPVEVFQSRLLFNEYRRGLPDELEDVDLNTFAYGFEDLREAEIKSLVNASSSTQNDILTLAIADDSKTTYDNLVSTIKRSDANPKAIKSLLGSIRKLKEQEVLEEEYRDTLPTDKLEEGVVAISMDNFTSFKRDSMEKLEVQIAIGLRRIKQGLRDDVLKGPISLIFDESHEFCSSDNEISTAEIVDMIDLGRAYDIPMVFSTQRPSQLDPEIIDGLSHFFIGPNVPPDQRMDLLRAADLVDHEDYVSGKWTKIFRYMKSHEFLQVDSERSLWRVVDPFAPPCHHPWEEDD